MQTRGAVAAVVASLMTCLERVLRVAGAAPASKKFVHGVCEEKPYRLTWTRVLLKAISVQDHRDR